MGTYTNSPFDAKLGLVLTRRDDTVEGYAPVESNTQPAGGWHGGASATMVETLGSIGAQDHAGPDGHAVGIELSVSHLRSVTSGYVHGVATPLHLGRSQTTYLVELRDDDGNLIASGRITCRIITTDWRGQ